MDIMDVINAHRGPCSCGQNHETTISDIKIGSGLVNKVGSILKENGFPENILVVADENTKKAASGIEKSLKGFNLTYKIYDDLRVGTISHVKEIAALIKGKDIALLSVGTGSLNDICRLASKWEDKKLCLFATAPSMDGFASYGAPLVDNGFKMTYDAKSPEVIIGDTKILARAPKELKSAGFGDMIAKYAGLIDWRISNLLTGEPCCEKIAALTKNAVDELMDMADRVTEEDEETAGKIFGSLIKTGVAMSFMKSPRPASGSEHIVAHLIECVELRDNIIPNYHGDDVGVSTLSVLKEYEKMADCAKIEPHKDNTDWDDVYKFYGNMAEDVKKLNTPDTVTDLVDVKKLSENWQKIREIIKSVPSYEECLSKMEKAGCKITVADIGKSEKLFSDAMKYSPYMRRRLTLLRLKSMIEYKMQGVELTNQKESD